MRLLIVVLNYRVSALTVECLKSLAHEIPDNPGTRVVIVENGSGDDSAARLQHSIAHHGWQPWAKLRVLPQNLGFTGGNNFVIRTALASPAPPERILLLNADTIVTKGAIGAVMRCLDQHPSVGIAGSQLVFPDGSPQGTPFRFQGIASEFDRGARIAFVSRLLSRWAACPPKPPVAGPVDWVAGASMLIRTKVIENIGPLDDGYFAYFEDMDFCLKAWRAGWETWYVPESKIIHLEGGSSGIRDGAATRRPDYWFDARRRFFLSNHGAAYAALADSAFFIGRALGGVARRIKGRPASDPPGFLADSIRHSVFLRGFKIPVSRGKFSRDNR